MTIKVIIEMPDGSAVTQKMLDALGAALGDIGGFGGATLSIDHNVQSVSVTDRAELINRCAKTLEVNGRVSLALQRMAYTHGKRPVTIGDVISLTRDDYLALNGFGPGSLKDLERALADLGLELKGSKSTFRDNY